MTSLQTRIHSVVVLAVGTGMLLPPGTALSEVTKPQATRRHDPAVPTDVVLQPDGRVTGHLVNGFGSPVSGRRIAISYGKHVVARATSDRNGAFEIRNMRPGVHRITTKDGSALLRMWKRESAPPAARRKVLIMSGPTIVRANNRLNPEPLDLAIGLGIATAVGVVAGVTAYEDGKKKAEGGLAAEPDPPQSP